MVLSKENKRERMHVICKVYLLLKGKATAQEIFNFIKDNNFGLSNDLGYYEVVDYLRSNVHKSHKVGRGCLKNCYGYTQEGNKARVYHIEED